ncbi:MAG: ThuA domain-containing protein [Spirosomaceae bacterium]|nr:ThuA domain-containing protein [Spirosomataceae bacterium]
MKNSLITALLILSSITTFAQKKTTHIVFVIGDEEYRSEESMPMLGEILHRELGAKISLCYPLNTNGIIDPNITDNIEGLEALATADLMVVFTRWRNLPANQAKMITDYAESGRPMVGFRTATHTFMYKDNPEMQHLNNDWPAKVFGQQWITHHGHFEDGNAPLTEVSILPNAKTKILNGFEPFKAYSWLYHVDGGEWKLNGDAQPFLSGKSLRSNHEMSGNLDKFSLTNPVAWTKTYTGTSGKAARVFFTTLGHPYDFKNESMRKLALNGIYWSLGMEKQIPKKGVNAEVVAEYNPNNSGFGEKFKKNMKPMVIE